jgi:agmatine/peptidylarginine deiminase
VRAEFEKQEIVLVDGTDLPRHWPDLFVSLVDALRGRVDLVVLVNDSFDEEEVRELIEEAGLPGDSLTLAAIEHDTMWLRDFGPVVTVDDQGRPVILDSQYGGADRRLDDEVPQRFAALLGLPLLSTALALEGGNLLANGDGICVTTADTFERNAHLGVEATVRAALLRHYGCDRLVVLEPLVGEETGHVDMFLTFPSPSVAVVGEYRPSDDAENAELLDRNADRLDGQSTRNGPLRVVRMPMPAHFDGVWRSYTNVLYANGAVLVPTYETSHPEDQRRAFRIFANLLPGWEVVGIEAEGLTSLGGALHCVTATVGPVGAKRRLARVRAIPALELLPVRPEPVIVPDVYGPLTPLGKRPGRAG